MAFSLIGSVSTSSPGGGDVTTAGLNTTGATLLVALISDFAGAGQTTVTDNQGNSWTALTARTSPSNCRARLYYVLNPTTNASHTFTADTPVNASFPSICVAAYSGAHASNVFDQESGTGNSSLTSLQPGSLTPAEDNCLVIAGLSFDTLNTISVDGSFSILQQRNYAGGTAMGGALAAWIQTTAGASNPTFSWSSSAQAAAAQAVFKSDLGGGGGGKLAGRMGLLGVGC